MARGARSARPDARVTCLPLADGGEGTLDALADAGGRLSARWVRGPLGDPVRARFLLLPRRTAVVEMAQAAGLLLVPPARRDPVRATTFGVGELFAAALAARARRIVVTVGGSATVDAGSGMAAALGAKLLDADGKPIEPGGLGLLRLARIDVSPVRRRLRGVTVLGATDVRSPLLGPRGARLYTAQKGATPSQMRLLDRALANFARVVRRDLGLDVARLPGGGAAGGLGAGLVALLGAKLVPGADTIFELLGLDAALRHADLVLTGEGSLDAQTAQGKLVARVAAHARRVRVPGSAKGAAGCSGIPVWAFAGRVMLPPRAVSALGLSGVWGLTERGISKRVSVRNAAVLLEERVGEVLRGTVP